MLSRFHRDLEALRAEHVCFAWTPHASTILTKSTHLSNVITLMGNWSRNLIRYLFLVRTVFAVEEQLTLTIRTNNLPFRPVIKIDKVDRNKLYTSHDHTGISWTPQLHSPKDQNLTIKSVSEFCDISWCLERLQSYLVKFQTDTIRVFGDSCRVTLVVAFSFLPQNFGR